MQLEWRELLCLAGQRGLSVRCVAGTLWVTQPGDRKDSVLEPGEGIALDRPGKAVVQALTPARLTLVQGDAAAPLRRGSALAHRPGLHVLDVGRA